MEKSISHAISMISSNALVPLVLAVLSYRPWTGQNVHYSLILCIYMQHDISVTVPNECQRPFFTAQMQEHTEEKNVHLHKNCPSHDDVSNNGQKPFQG